MAKPRKHRRLFLTSRLIEVVLTAVVLTATASISYATSAHDFTSRAIDGSALPLQRFRGQPILLVNTASRCGFTPQYKDLQTLVCYAISLEKILHGCCSAWKWGWSFSLCSCLAPHATGRALADSDPAWLCRATG
jgi:hypothetical protein